VKPKKECDQGAGNTNTKTKTTVFGALIGAAATVPN